MIIGLSGRIKSGKSTAATLIKQLNPYFEEKYFAFKLKQICSLLTGDDIKLFETQEGKDEFMEVWGMTRRKMLQTIGTNNLRDGFDRQIWVKSLFADYKPKFGGAGMTDYDLTEVYPNWIISDVRFPNEANEIKQRGGVIIRIERPYSHIYKDMWNAFIVNAGGDFSNENFRSFVKILDIELYEKISHSSEIGLDDYDNFDLIIDNTSTIQNFVDVLYSYMKTNKLA